MIARPIQKKMHSLFAGIMIYCIFIGLSPGLIKLHTDLHYGIYQSGYTESYGQKYSLIDQFVEYLLSLLVGGRTRQGDLELSIQHNLRSHANYEDYSEQEKIKRILSNQISVTNLVYELRDFTSSRLEILAIIYSEDKYREKYFGLSPPLAYCMPELCCTAVQSTKIEEDICQERFIRL